MTEQQFNALADLLGLVMRDREAAYRIIFNNESGDVVAEQFANRIRQADATIRAAYVVHSPMEFRITVGHRDTHRMPGSLKLKIGDTVRLVGQSTERWIPVRVTALPDSPAGYYGGIITEQLVKTKQIS